MNPRFKGLGKVIFLLPLLLAILLRMVLGDEDEHSRPVFLCILFALSGAITIGIGAIQDKKAGIDIFARKAWTSEVLESQHIFFYVPLRIAGLVALVVSPAFLLL